MKLPWPVFIALLLCHLTAVKPLLAAVVLNEIFANPVDENEEFIELYNSSNESITLTGYKIADLTKSFTINEATIAGKNFYLLKKIDTKIALNNDAETVTLKDAGDAAVDSFSYDGTTEGKSYSRIADGGNWLALTEPTPLTANQSPPSPTPSPSPSPVHESNQTASSPSPTPPASLATVAPPSPTASPTPSPSPSHKIKSINLLTSASTPPILGTQSAALAKPIDWTLAILLLSTGTGILLVTTAIIVKLWRKG